MVSLVYEKKLLTPGSLKSLMQKLIRYQPQTVIFSFGAVSGEFLLGLVLILLVSHHGCQVPALKMRLVSGVEGMFKRLVVAVCEDAYVEDKFWPLLTCA